MSLIYSHHQMLSYSDEFSSSLTAPDCLELDLGKLLYEQCQPTWSLSSSFNSHDDFHYYSSPIEQQQQQQQAKSQESNQQQQELMFLDETQGVGLDFVFDDELFLQGLNELVGESSLDTAAAHSPPVSFMADSVSPVSSPPSPPPAYAPYAYTDEDESELSASVAESVSSDTVGRVKRGGKVDKRESNKRAAERYRLKKQRERDDLFAECERYAARNTDMKKKIDDTLSEISFIKSLLVEALVATRK